MTEHVMNTYGRLPVSFVRGEGAWLWDEQGNKYLDAVGGIAVCNLGHCHPAVTAAIQDQAATLMHTSNWYGIPLQEQLADRLCELSGMERAFFSNSGAEANEAAIKIARLYGHNKGILNPTIIVTEGSFHGRTMATLTATGNRKVQAGFEPLVSGFVRVPFNDIEAVSLAGTNNHDIVAILVEPVEGEGGVIAPDEDYLKNLRKLCDEKGWLLMLDEIQTGMGRTGQWFACQHEDVIPDVMTLAKGLGNGFPVGACLARGIAAETLKPGNHGSTFGGNPLACRTALAVIETMNKENIPATAAATGARIVARLQSGLTKVAGIKTIRHKGMLIGIELNRECGELMQKALQQGLLINVTAMNIVRLLPPLNLTNEEADQLADGLVSLLADYLAAAA
ncbi:MAG: aspartate aminotransferase family protein [Gammaproteobacteria bacterium]|nr:aspartate aminotransferase family protein [Gammaproteobacteria bacterium]